MRREARGDNLVLIGTLAVVVLIVSAILTLARSGNGGTPDEAGGLKIASVSGTSTRAGPSLSSEPRPTIVVTSRVAPGAPPTSKPGDANRVVESASSQSIGASSLASGGSVLAAAGGAPSVLPTASSTAAPSPTSGPTATPPLPAPSQTGKAAAPAVNSADVVVIDEDSGVVLYEKNSHHRTAPASVTKIATALVALERGDPKSTVKVSFDSTELVDSTLMGIHVGDQVTLEDLLYGLMLPSGNDAALAIANEIAGSKSAFVALMNQKAKSLGLTDSQFRNPHGLDEDGHYSSAYDLTMMARYAMRTYPLFGRLAAAKSWDVGGARPYTVYNLNKMLRSYAGADGVKIGYTDNAGKTIIASATRNGHRVYVGLMRCGDIVTDSAPLLDWAFANFTWTTGG